MKHRRLFIFASLMMTFALSACSNPFLPNLPTSRNDVNSNNSGNGDYSSNEHTHSWKDWEIIKDPTCKEEGEKHRYCEICGYEEIKTISTLNHTWSNWEINAGSSCLEGGYQTRHCLNCGEKETKSIPAKDHTWGDAQKMAAGEGQVAYDLFTCASCGFLKADVKASDGTITGSIKSGTPEGFIKLASNGNLITWKINVPGTDILGGTLFQRAVMETWTSTRTSSYSQVKNNGGNQGTNFVVTVNGKEVDMSDTKNRTYEEMLSNGDDSSYIGSNYSPIANCPIGPMELWPGENIITYTRLDSYNLLISDLIFEYFIEGPAHHEHIPSSDWSYNDTQHWHTCTAAGCPVAGSKIDIADHTWGEQYDVVPATCTAKGSYKVKCTVCSKVVSEEIAKLNHAYDEEPAATYAAGEGYIATAAYNCNAGCNTSALRWSALDFDASSSSSNIDVSSTYVRFAGSSAENRNGVASSSCHIIYKINVPTAVAKAGLAFKIRNTSNSINEAPVFAAISSDSLNGFYDNGDGTFTKAEVRYGIKVNGVEYRLGQDPYGNNHSGETNWFEWPVEFPLVAGVNTIDVFPYGGYRAQLMEFQVTGLPHVQVTHQHTFGDWKSDDTNHWHTCSVAGCPVAGYVMDKAAHTFGEPTVKTPATCTEDGAGEVECCVCGYKKDVVIPAAHKWGDAQKMAAGEGQVAYDLFTCASCGLLKADVKASDGTITGSNKDGTPEGFIKLKSNQDVVTWKINVPGTSSLSGTLYQRGAMDSWSSNKTVTYAKSGVGNQGTNFVMTVNGKEVDMSDTKNRTYEEMLSNGDDSSYIGSNYSPIADCPIGAIELQPGENVITYKRLGSYNLVISDIIFLGKAHTHVAASEWSKDENQHWHVCTDANCPIDGARLDAAAHTFGEAYDVVPATCSAEGSYKVRCTVCGYKKDVVIPAGHKWGDAQTAISDAIPHECSGCHTVAYDLAVASPAKLRSDITWNITGLPAGNYEIQLNACAASSTLSQKYDNRYQFKVDSGEYIGASDNNATYASYGLGTGEKLENCQWSKPINTIAIGEGAAQFTIHWTNAGYSAFIAGIRLVKVA